MRSAVVVLSDRGEQAMSDHLAATPSSGQLEARLRVFGAYRCASRFYLYLPVLVVILLEQGLTYTEAGLIVATHGLAMTLLRGVAVSASTRIGSRRDVLTAAELVKSAGVAGLAVGVGLLDGSLAVLLAAQAVSGLGFAMASTAESSLLFEIAKDGGAEDRYREMESRTQGYAFLALLTAGVLGAVLATRNLELPVYLSIVPSVVAAGLLRLLRMPAHHVVAAPASVAPAPGGTWWKVRPVADLVLAYAVNRAILLTVFVWALPLMLFTDTGISLGFFGLILGLYSVTGFVLGKQTGVIVKRVGERRLLGVVVPAALVAGLALMAIGVDAVFVLVPVLIGAAAAIVRPVSFAAIARRAPEHRADITSFAERSFGLLNAALVIVTAPLFAKDTTLALVVLLAFAMAAPLLGALSPIARRQRSVLTADPEAET